MAVLPLPKALMALLARVKENPRLIDWVAYVFLHVTGFSTFWLAVTELIPSVLGTTPVVFQALNYSLAVIMYLGVVTNVQLIHYRHSTIRNVVLTPPSDINVNEESNTSREGCTNGSTGLQNRRVDLTDQVKHFAEQFTIQPYNSADTWHICASCEVFVPPRSWHCFMCNICVLRRDHHCVFARACIGQDNHNNFLGLLVYMASGSLYATLFIFIDTVVLQHIPWWMWLLRCLAAVYTLFFDFSLYFLLATLNFTGCLASLGVLTYYTMLALKGQTSADQCRKIRRSLSKQSEYSYENFRSFVGPFPFYQILWPFHTPVGRMLQSSQGSSSSSSNLKAT